MQFKDYKFLVMSDLYRKTGKKNIGSLCQQLFFGEAVKYCFWMRTCSYTYRRPLFHWLVFPLAYALLNHYKYKFGLSIPFSTQIGSGFYVGHFGGIFISNRAVLGKNCNISQDVTIGQSNRGPFKGVPVLGDNVYVGPGAKVFGKIKIGNNVAIGANCVVTRDVPDNAVVIGIPGRVINLKGSEGYINRTDYESSRSCP